MKQGYKAYMQMRASSVGQLVLSPPVRQPAAMINKVWKSRGKLLSYVFTDTQAQHGLPAIKVLYLT